MLSLASNRCIMHCEQRWGYSVHTPAPGDRNRPGDRAMNLVLVPDSPHNQSAPRCIINLQVPNKPRWPSIRHGFLAFLLNRPAYEAASLVILVSHLLLIRSLHAWIFSWLWTELWKLTWFEEKEVDVRVARVFQQVMSHLICIYLSSFKKKKCSEQALEWLNILQQSCRGWLIRAGFDFLPPCLIHLPLSLYIHSAPFLYKYPFFPLLS